MLVEVKDVEVFIEPKDILPQALSEGEITIQEVIRQCIYEESVSEVLDTIDKEDIESYCISNRLLNHLLTLDDIAIALPSLDKTDKAKLLWLLLKCEGNSHA